MLYLSRIIPSTIFYGSIFSEVLPIATCPLDKFMSHKRLEDVPKRHPDILRTSPYDSICNAMGCLGMHPQRGVLGAFIRRQFNRNP